MTSQVWTANTEILSETESVCPECLARLSAVRVKDGGNVYLEKDCPEHGHFKIVIWRDVDHFNSWVRPEDSCVSEKSNH